MVGIVEHLVQRDAGLLRPGDGTGYGGMPEPVGMPEPEGLGDTVQRAAREAAGLALARPVEIHEQGTGLGAPSGNPFAQGVEGRGGEGLHPALSPPALQCHGHGSRVEVEVFEVEGYDGPTAQGEVEHESNGGPIPQGLRRPLSGEGVEGGSDRVNARAPGIAIGLGANALGC